VVSSEELLGRMLAIRGKKEKSPITVLPYNTHTHTHTHTELHIIVNVNIKYL
jgi:hypothetical protein